MHLLIGQRVADTQTGLRGVPATLIPHLLRLMVEPGRRRQHQRPRLSGECEIAQMHE